MSNLTNSLNNSPNNSLIADIAIIGGGISGLLLQNKLKTLGYSTILLEQNTLGHGQTINSQGIIHGGIKYALLGQITEAASAISTLPQIWSDYFNNQSDLDLSSTKILSRHHDLWNNGELKNKLKQILMQKTLSSAGSALGKSNYPELFNNKQFKGSIYRINETVIDTYSLLESLSNSNKDKIIKIDSESLNIILDNNKNINNISFSQNKNIYNLSAQKYIFTAGQNNQAILDLLPHLPKMQKRPLHMVLAKFPEPNVLYGHYVGAGMQPELTITTHYAKDGQYIWYIGGKIAETGIYLNKEQQILQAKVELKNLFPWLNMDSWQWETTKINRAEPLQANNIRPDTAQIYTSKNAMVGWPSKLTMAPMLVEKVVNKIKDNNITNKYNQIDIADYNLKTAKITQPIWEELFKSTAVNKNAEPVT